LIVLIGNNIHAHQGLGKLILALEVDTKIFDEVLNPLLDVESSKIIILLVFKLDDDYPIQEKTHN
jgi:hypothetical protein